MRPQWSGAPRFISHSYRSLAADSVRRELILFQNVTYTLPDWGHAEWAFLDSSGTWSRKGQLKWPWGTDYETPQSIRVCYPTVALKNRAVHFCGVSDILEPRSAWRAYKRKLTGLDWDYDLRRLFYTWCPDVTQGRFKEWIEIASAEKFGGRLLPGDLWVDSHGLVHVVWEERAIDERLRPHFFPSALQTLSIKYAVLRNGETIARKTLAEGGDGKAREAPYCPRFQVTPDNRIFVIWFVDGVRTDGSRVAENRFVELRDSGVVAEPQALPLRVPFTQFFTASARAGSPQSMDLELLGQRLGSQWTISYAKVRLP